MAEGEGGVGGCFLGGFPAVMEMQVAFPSAHTVSCYMITSENDALDSDPKDLQQLGANEGNSWVVSATNGSVDFQAGEWGVEGIRG